MKKSAYLFLALNFQIFALPQSAFADASSDLAAEIRKFERHQSSFAHWQKGSNLENTNNLPAAIEEYSKSIADDPDSSGAYVARARVYADLKKYPNAVLDLKKVLSLEPKKFESVRGLCTLYEKMGDASNAIALLSDTIRSQPNNLIYYSLRARLYEKTGQKLKANADFIHVYDGYTKKIAEETSITEIAELYAIRANTVFEQKQYQKALDDLSTSLFYNPDDASAYGSRGDTYHELKQFSKAVSDFKQAAYLDPREIQYGWRRAYPEVAELFKKVSDAKLAVDKEPSADNYLALALANSDVGNFEDAIGNYSQAIEKQPNKIELHLKRGSCHRQNVIRLRVQKKSALEESQAATKDYSAAIELDPKNAWAWALRADSYIDRGFRRKALEDLEQAIKLNGSYGSAYSMRAAVYKDLGRYDDAKQDMLRSFFVDSASAQSSVDRLLEPPHKNDLMSEAELDFDNPEDPAGKKLEGPSIQALEHAFVRDNSFEALENEKKSAEYAVKEAEKELKLTSNDWAKSQFNSATASVDREASLIKARAALDAAKNAKTPEQMALKAKMIQSDLIATSGKSSDFEEKASRAQEKFSKAKLDLATAKSQLSSIKFKLIPASIDNVISSAETFKVLLEKQEEESKFLRELAEICKKLSVKKAEFKDGYLGAANSLDEKSANIEEQLKFLSGNSSRALAKEIAELNDQLKNNPSLREICAPKLALLTAKRSQVDSIFKRWNPATTVKSSK